MLGLDFFWCAVVEGLVETLAIPPMHPLEGGDLYFENIGPAAGVNDLVLVRSVNVLGQRVVVAVTHAAGGFNDPSIDKVLMVGQRYVLRTVVTVVDEARG